MYLFKSQKRSRLVFLEKLKLEELYEEQLIYKRTPMDFIDHLWELLSRKQLFLIVIALKIIDSYRIVAYLENCSSFNELSQSLQYTLQRAKADHPMVTFG